MRRLRPSPSMTVAVIALVFAGTGGASAALRLISGNEIKQHTITDVNVARESLTGEAIQESTLGSVPRAVRADEALRLEGLRAEDFVRSDCGNGTIKASGFVNGFAIAGGDYQENAPAINGFYSCQPDTRLLARKVEPGLYEVAISANVPGHPMVSGHQFTSVGETTTSTEGLPPAYRTFMVQVYGPCIINSFDGVCPRPGKFTFELI